MASGNHWSCITEESSLAFLFRNRAIFDSISSMAIIKNRGRVYSLTTPLHHFFPPLPLPDKVIKLSALVPDLAFLSANSLPPFSPERDQKEDTMVNVQDLQDQRRPSSAEKQQQKSFDMFFSSKRKVPNASDPLHNR
ncbi:hypothetical protein OIU84_015604 [Salix udensis]|uniref:Uncharacterized protein n=1 Tax=Salix udensis TaxID=889485 RepID=A0AAD6J7N7_9ROSI|nr:hypothetical protein OIU84_015604 [Salix udensis]